MTQQETDTKTLKQLCENVKANVKCGAPYREEFQHSNGYTVTLKYNGHQMTVPFYMGYAYTERPTAYEVIECLLSDSQGVENEDFENWCENLGYDIDSRRAEKIYKQCVGAAKRLHRLLGDDYDTFMYATEY